MAALNVLSICGSLRKGSFNAMVQRLLPSLAPDGMTIKPAPPFADFPLYNADALGPRNARPRLSAASSSRSRQMRSSAALA
jgi:NAD(P)H-dependent FMN reductase